MNHFDRSGIPYVEVATDLCYRRLGWHWTPAGNRFVADKVLRFLRDQNLIAPPQSEFPRGDAHVNGYRSYYPQ
jgi:hypothetical protein